ncbi:hypothetical protein [Kineosporia sp. R_H_3]|uniref:hypothetical protein n=1 Tax=Kineosporia sp. R_H_3 TaxID=1961848 RepID=UPI000B4AFBB5|nr:hypothetical protein [Kineosporia sp. R_H_3]
MPAPGVGPAQHPTAATAPSARDRDGVLDALVAATDDVTVEEFRLVELRVESDARLGRRLLYLLSNTEWVRRTTEHLDVGRARVVETEVVVDVDLSYLPGAVLDEDVVWLPVLAVPPPVAGPREQPGPDRDPVTSMEVTDAGGARISKATQAQVHRWLAPALAELVLGRLPRTRPDGASGPTRDELVLLAAALRRLLPGTGADIDGGPDGGEGAPMLERGRAQVEERLIVARTGLLAAVRLDLDRPRPVLRSRLVDMVAALVGVVHAVVPVAVDGRPTSFAVRLPGRRLHPERRRRLSTSARAHLRVDLYTASPHSDRVVHLGLPEGISVGVTTASAPAGARIALSDVRPVEELRALLTLVLDGEREPAWVRRRLAGLAVDKVESSLEALQHLRTAAGVPDPTARLRMLRARLLAVAAQDTAAPVTALQQTWDGGTWLPASYERRLVVNTATPGLVHVRASVVDGSAQRATTGDAAVDADVEVSDSTVLDTARDTNAINAVLLAAVTLLLLAFGRGENLRTVNAEILATVLTLFPAIQASRADRPDRSTLRGVLSQPTYLLSLATVFPPLALAGALAAAASHPAVVAVLALAAQLGLQLLLRRPGRARAAGSEPALLLRTAHPPDLSRLDVLRGSWCRTLVADALLLGRLTQGHLVGAPDSPGALSAALDVTLGAGLDDEHPGRGPAGGRSSTSVHGLFHATAAGRSMTFVLAGGRPGHTRPAPDDDGPVHPGERAAEHTRRSDPTGGRMLVRQVPVEPGRLSAVEPPAWIVEAFVGLVPGRLEALPVEDHPVAVLLAAARADDLPVLLVQTPALPPTYAAEDRDWMRLRVGVPFVPGEDLGRLARYLTALDGLRTRHPRRGAARVHTYAVPEFATHQGGQTAPDETDRAGRRTNDVLRDVRADDVGTPPDAGTEALAVCAWARVGLSADVLAAAGGNGPTRLVAMTSVVLHGLAAQLVVLAPLGGTGPRVPYVEALRGALHREAVVEPIPPAPVDAADDPAPGPRCVVRLQVRLPERPHALRGLLGDLADTLGGLDTWFALFRVADGRSVQGRLMARVPPAAADAVRRRSSRDADDALLAAAADHGPRRGGRPAVEDDPVVDLGVLRTTAP